jgi:hypothetical protein
MCVKLLMQKGHTNLIGGWAEESVRTIILGYVGFP